MDQADLGLGDGVFTPSPGLAATLAHGMGFFDRPSGVVIPQFASSLSSSLDPQSVGNIQNSQAASADQNTAATSSPTTSAFDYDHFSDPVASSSPAPSAYDQFADAVGSAPRDAVTSSEVSHGTSDDSSGAAASDGAPRSVDAVASSKIGSGAQSDPVWDPSGEVAASALVGRAVGPFVDQAIVALKPSVKDFANYLSESADALAQAPRDMRGYASDLADNPFEFLRRAGPTFAGLGLSIPTMGVGASAAALRGGPTAAEEISALAAPSGALLSRGLIGAEEAAGRSAAVEGTEAAGSLAQPASAAAEGELAAGESATINADPAAWKALSPSEKLMIKQRLEQIFAGSKEVVYDFMSNGLKYVGQTSRGFQRMVEHLYKGKLHPDDIESILFDKFPGGKFAREVAERARIEKLGGLGKTANKILPVSDAKLSNIPLPPPFP